MATMWPLIIALLLLLLPFALSSKINLPLIGNVYPAGHFYATLQIGNPLKPYFLDIDTGSSLTWLECNHPDYGCKGCNPMWLQAGGTKAAIAAAGRWHPWTREGSVGFVAQLKAQQKITKNIIGHCLNIHGNGNLYIGDFKIRGNVTWVPMSDSLSYYSPGRATLRYDKKQIRHNPAFKAVFDSGAAYTYMPYQMYSELLSKVQDTLRGSTLTEVPDPTLPHCWKGKMPFRSVDDVKNEFKNLTLEITHAHRSINMDITPENYVIVTEHGNVCLAILDGSLHEGLNHLILIGDVTMQDMSVIYDNESHQLGWVHGKCDKMQDLESVVDSRL